MHLLQFKIVTLLLMSLTTFALFSASLVNLASSTSELVITIETDKPSYSLGELVNTSGLVTDSASTPIGNAAVGIEVIDSRNNTIFLDGVYSSPDGYYEDSFRLSTSAPLGQYTIFVTANSAEYSPAHANSTIEVVGGCNFELFPSAGWNMISFPCIPIDANFSSIFSGVSYYQVLTWNGTSYIRPTTAEAGIGYWALVLEDTTLTITSGMPVESYERDLDAGWSMIGSIYPCVVDADCVFPSYYQLLTWDGASYVSASTIEPGKGYWALVLESTHIVVDESCCILS